MEYSIPAIRRLQLGKRLRALRKQSGLSIHQAGPDLDMSSATLNRIENGQHRTQVLEELMALAREAHRSAWWVVQGITSDSYAALESEATEAPNFELAFLPGILQTEDYATALFALASTRERNANLAIRMNRVERLTGDNALKIHVVIDETALTRPVGGWQVMRRQLQHLLELGQQSNITIQVLPKALGAHLGLRGAFSVLTFPPDTIEDLGYIEHAAGSMQISKPSKVIELRKRFDAIAKLALDANESAALIARLAQS